MKPFHALALVPAILLSWPAAATAQSRAGEAAWEASSRRFPGHLDRRAIAGGPGAVELVGSAVVGPSILDERSARSAAGEVLDGFRDALGVARTDLAELDVLAVAGTHSIRYEQRIGGLPVIGSRVEMRLSNRGELTLLRASGLVHGPLAPFSVPAGDAGELARVSVTGTPIGRLWASGTRRVICAREERGELRPRPAWLVEVSDPNRPDASWRVTLAGDTGETIEVSPLFLGGVSGTVDGRAIATGPHGGSTPSTLPMKHLDIASIDAAAALVRITNNGCKDEEAVMSADGTKVAFVSDCDGDREICVASSDGSGFLQLTSNGAADYAPAISADGSRIVFVSEVDGDPEIFTIRSDGTGLLQLTSNTVSDTAPAISADGTRVVYVSTAGGDPEIFRVETSGTTPVQLTSNGAKDLEPTISGDGSTIAWVSDLDGDLEIFAMDWSGSSVRQLTMNSVEDRQPDLNEDGSRVVFGSRLDLEEQGSPDPSSLPAGGTVGRTILGRNPLPAPNEFDLFEIATDGTGLRRLTFGEGTEEAPRGDATGTKIAYAVTGTKDIRLVDRTTWTTLTLANNAARDSRPSPASDWMKGAFTADDGDREVWVWNLTVPGAGYATKTDAAGAYSLPIPDGGSAALDLTLSGAHANVVDMHPSASRLRAFASGTAPITGLDAHFNPSGDAEFSSSQTTAYYHATEAHDGIAAILHRPPLSLPGALSIDPPLVERVNFPTATANAFYNIQRKDATFFMGGGPTRPNTAYDSVVYHEYGHYFDDSFGGIGTLSACESGFAQSEGVGDVVSMFLTASDVVGEDFYGPGTALRDYSKFPWEAGAAGARGRQYDCADCPVSGGKPEPHFHGEAFAGFAWDLRADLGPTIAEDLVFGALTSSPPSMQAAVTDVFILASTIYGGSPATSPLYESICTAAAKHGFDCVPRGDWESFGCASACPGALAVHRTTGTEWMGATVDWETACEPTPNGDDDGLTRPPVIHSGETVSLSVTLKVNPALKHSGRYGPPLPGPQLPGRRVYLNGWVFVNSSPEEATPTKILGVGSTNPTTGPDSFETTGGGGLLNTVAFNPDTWPGDTYVFTFTATMPTVAGPSTAYFRFRLDWGQDCGRIGSCLSDPLLDGPCGPARFGEVEDHQFALMVP